jgi:hypothetical protein
LSRLNALEDINIPFSKKQHRIQFCIKNTQNKNAIWNQKITKGDSIVGETYDLEVEDKHNYVANGYIVHNSGKDKTNIADVAPRRLIKDTCLVKYIYPTLVMGRDNLWDGIGGDGFPYMKHIPESLIEGVPNKQRMTINIKNGSIFQVAGSDNPDSLRGGNAKLDIFSEWSEHDPYAWDVVEPILRENDGICIFNFTPKGNNHAKSLVDFAKGNPKWFVQILTAEETGVFTSDQLKEIKEDTIKRFITLGRSEEEAISYFEQEYMCSFDTPVIGSYYGAGIRRLESENRLTRVPYEASLPVNTAWDIGVGDSTAIWFWQSVGREIRVIDYYENSGEGVPHYADILNKKGYNYGSHYAPHDIEVREFTTGKSRMDTARNFGINFRIVPKLSLEDGIEAARNILPQCWFDQEKTYRGYNALKNYRKDWDEKNKIFRVAPKHDWSSHAADSFRYLAVVCRPQEAPKTYQPKKNWSIA